MRSFLLAIAVSSFATLLNAASVGSGSPTAQIQQSFINAFSRGKFSALAALPPVADVRNLGSPGLVQEFPPAGGGNQKLALVKPDPFAPPSNSDTLQVYSDIYAYYTSSLVGVDTAGYPTIDTTSCPANSFGQCNYQLFTKNHALFVYSSPAGTFDVADPFFTEWNAGGGIGGILGTATSAARAVTSRATTQGTRQLFSGGVIYSWSTGSNSASTYTISGTIYVTYNQSGGHTLLGFPTSEEIVLPSGLHRQTFESSKIEWTPGSNPVVIFPIAEIDITYTGSLSLKAGQTAILTALVYDIQGSAVTGRALTWSTSNGKVVAVEGNGGTATITAVGGGVAYINLTGEGKASAPVAVRVDSPCCGIGEGAPTAAITQAFQTAVSRNHLAVALPNSTAVTPLGGGYIQTLTAPDGSGTNYVIGESGKSAIAYLLTGSLLTTYLANGGFSGPLGYPASDASAGGTQLFESGSALAGSPVRLVPSPIASKWLGSGAESGSLGAVTADASGFTSLTAIGGNGQTFAQGSIFGILSGARRGQAFVTSGLILARYLALQGPSGTLGTPVSDPYSNGAVQVQNFENGTIDLQPGASVAVEHFNPRNPAITVAPGRAGPGGRIHIDISGFAFGSSLTVSVTGQPAFSVQAAGGGFGWDIVVPGNAKPGIATIQAKAAQPNLSGSVESATGSYTIASLPELQPRLSVVSGDQQTGAPGSLVAAPLIAVVRDLAGNPLSGLPVSYAVSPGGAAQVTAVTGADGLIQAVFRLPPVAGTAAISLSTGGQVVSFSALAKEKKISNFPAFAQLPGKDGLTAALASTIRYYQDSGLLGSPNGVATPAAVNQFLNGNNGYSVSESGASIANPWITLAFAGVSGGIAVETPTLDRVRDLLSGGSPLVIVLNVQVEGAVAGSVAVNAIGVDPDGSIVISDPNAAFARGSLSDYLNGFAAQSHTVAGTLASVIHVVPAGSTPLGFVTATYLSAGASVASAAGSCRNSIDLLDPPTIGGSGSASPGGIRFIACDGAEALYQLSLGAQKTTAQGTTVIDLANRTPTQIPSPVAAAYAIGRSSGAISVTAQNIAIASVVNTAGFGPGLSSGGLFSIFGSGLSTGAADVPAVTVSGQPATVLAVFPYQINAWMPSGIAAGSAALQVTGVLGSASRDIAVLSAAPGVFVVGSVVDPSGTSRDRGAIVNQDGALNASATPAQRGQFITIYCTGLGATSGSGSLQAATADVTVVLDGTRLKPAFAGLTPGVTGLYQINVQLPAAITPGGFTGLSVGAGGETSNVVALAVQ